MSPIHMACFLFHCLCLIPLILACLVPLTFAQIPTNITPDNSLGTTVSQSGAIHSIR